MLRNDGYDGWVLIIQKDRVIEVSESSGEHTVSMLRDCYKDVDFRSAIDKVVLGSVARRAPLEDNIPSSGRLVW